MLIGHSYQAWISRGGSFSNNSYSGSFALNFDGGNPDSGRSFRPVLVLSSGI